MNTINIHKMIHTVFIVMIAFLISQGNLTAQNNSSKNSDNKGNTYNKIAKDLSSRLSRRVNLTKDQSDKVSDILVDYQKDVADKWDKGSSDNTGGNKGITDDFRDADKKANDKIEKTLNGNELTSYLNAKKTWWSKIKDRVYSKDFYTLITYKEEDEDNASANNTGSNRDNKSSDNKTTVSNNKSSNNNTAGNDEKDMNAKFEPFAKQWATELMNQLNLSLQQAADIQDALIDYQKSIADLRLRMSNETNNDQNVRVADNNNNRKNNNSNDNIVGSNRNDRMSEFRDIDNSYNDKIENVLNDNQKPKYEKVKKVWWKDVKDRVFSNIRKENRNSNMTSTSGK